MGSPSGLLQAMEGGLQGTGSESRLPASKPLGKSVCLIFFFPYEMELVDSTSGSWYES